jgi:phosphoglycerate dehydrogenase-like enzyme
LRVPRFTTCVEDSHPRLLVALPPREELRTGLNRLLPEIAWAYLGSTAPSHRGNVEAMLVGGFTRDVGEFDAGTVPKLRFVQRLYTGVDGFPFDRLPEHVQVAGNVGAFGPFVSEHAIALALAAARDLRAAGEMVRTGRLRPAPVQRLLYRSTVVILGYGAIGREIARRLKPFEVRIIGLNRDGAPSDGADEMYSADRLREAVARGDFVFEVRPLHRGTRETIGKEELEAMRPDAIFVNVGRAGTVVEEALFHHLETHPTFRAGIDVWWNEDYATGALPSRFVFSSLPNFVGTPHSAGVAPGAEARTLERATENLARFFRDGRPDHVVDRAEYSR